MSRRASSFRRFQGATVQDTTQNILANNSQVVRTVAMRDQLDKTALGNNTWKLLPTSIEATSAMNPAKAQRIAASLHSTRK